MRSMIAASYGSADTYREPVVTGSPVIYKASLSKPFPNKGAIFVVFDHEYTHIASLLEASLRQFPENTILSDPAVTVRHPMQPFKSVILAKGAC